MLQRSSRSDRKMVAMTYLELDERRDGNKEGDRFKITVNEVMAVFDL
jgi:hypothetical protein